MTSIYEQALGSDFAKLHPMTQWRFGLASDQHKCQIGRGVMEEVWRGKSWVVPFLRLGASRRIMFPDRGKDIPFTIQNYAYCDSFGRETVAWARRFELPGKCRAFDATMVYSAARGVVVDYLGTRQHLAVDLHMSVGDQGELRLRSGEQRFYEGFLGFRFPMAISGFAEVSERWDEAAECFRIEVAVRNRRFGPLFGYRGSFTVSERPCPPEEIPLDVRPLREERRE
jgi:hypothetical protein